MIKRRSKVHKNGPHDRKIPPSHTKKHRALYRLVKTAAKHSKNGLWATKNRNTYDLPKMKASDVKMNHQ